MHNKILLEENFETTNIDNTLFNLFEEDKNYLLYLANFPHIFVLSNQEQYIAKYLPRTVLFNNFNTIKLYNKLSNKIFLIKYSIDIF